MDQRARQQLFRQHPAHLMTHSTTMNSILVNSLIAISPIMNSHLTKITNHIRQTHYGTFSPVKRSIHIKVTIA